MRPHPTYLVIILPPMEEEAVSKLLDELSELEHNHGGSDETMEPSRE